jgi:sugar-phosphatase
VTMPASGADGNVGSTVVLPCESVLFDCDGVLVNSDASVHSAWSRWAHEYGVDAEEVVAVAHGQRAEDTVRMFVPERLRAEALLRINALELESAVTVTRVPGAAVLLGTIPPARWSVVTSGTSSLARARLAAAGLPIPDVLVTADDVTRGKPHPDGYLAAAAARGVDIAHTVVVEDSASGVSAARAAGTGAVLGVGPRALATDADVVVPDLTGVRWRDSGLHQAASAVLLRGALGR